MSDDKKSGAAHWSDADFEKKIEEAKKAGKPVFVDFYAEWCGPCQMAAPIVDKLADEFAGKAYVVKVDVDENNATARQFGVISIPTVVTFNADGEKKEQKAGFLGEQGYRAMIEDLL